MTVSISHKKMNEIREKLESTIEDKEKIEDIYNYLKITLHYNEDKKFYKGFDKDHYENYTKQYIEKNRKKINEQERIRYQKKKAEKLKAENIN
jgi:hypothetical protein